VSYWDRLNKYRTHGPEAAGEWHLRPVKEFNGALGPLADEQLLPLGWVRGKELRWSRPLQSWAEKIIEFHPLKSGVGARWGVRLSFIPAIRERRKAAGALHLSYDPMDYQRDVSHWTLSRFSTDEELRVDAPDLVSRAVAGAQSLDACCRDLPSLVRCFEEKKARKYVHFGFQHYPKEVLAYAAVLGLVGRKDDAFREIEAAFERLEGTEEEEQQRYRRALAELWEKGI
jgi:hypothetical protein